MTKQEFVETLLEYSGSKPAGQKHLFRTTDRDCSACSPMMVYGVPVAKMFYEGVRRLVSSQVAVIPCRDNGDDRTVVEAYPAIVARMIAGRASYKSGSASSDSKSKLAVREQLTKQLKDVARTQFGLEIVLPSSIAKSVRDDFSGDRIDSVFCCIQAAWSSMQSDFGVPPRTNENEGWIVSLAD